MFKYPETFALYTVVIFAAGIMLGVFTVLNGW